MDATTYSNAIAHGLVFLALYAIVARRPANRRRFRLWPRTARHSNAQKES